MTTATVAQPRQAPPVIIDRPGVYDGMPDDVYHGDPVPGGSLSSTGARMLLPPSCPALFRYEQDHPKPRKREFDLGHAAHKLVLGAGPELVLIEADDYRTKAAREQRDTAHEGGAVPLLRAEYEQVQAMAEALRAHPLAGRLLQPGSGKPEQSLFWVDRGTRLWRRARLDWLPNRTNRRMVIPDYKTCVKAEPEGLRRVIYDRGYHQQAAWYLDAVQALGLAGADAMFVFVFQEKTPPYLVTVADPDPFAVRVGQHLNRMALMTYRECVESGHWPGYTDDVAHIALPGWVENQYAKELS